MKLIELYKHILSYCGIKTEDDGAASISLNGKTEPCLVEGKRLYLPLPEVMKRPAGEKEMIFHPFSEYINRGESPVVRKLKQVINLRINLATMVLLDRFISIVESPSIQKDLDPQQRELIKAVTSKKMTRPTGDGSPLREKLASVFMNQYFEKPDSFFCQVYLKKNGTFRNERYSRVGVVTFPIYEFLEESNKFNKEEKTILRDIIAFIYPGSMDDPESFNGGSNSMECPWLDCLLKTSYNLASRITDLVYIYQPYLIDKDDRVSSALLFNGEWVDQIDNLGAYQKEILLIPNQPGNEGESDRVQPKQEQKPAPAAAVAVPTPTSPQVASTPEAAVSPSERFVKPIQQPVQQQQAAQSQLPVGQNGKLDLGAALGGALQQPLGNQVMQPVMAPPAIQVWNPNVLQQQNMMQMQMQQLAMSSPSAASVMMGNNPMAYGQQPYYGQQIQPMRQQYSTGITANYSV